MTIALAYEALTKDAKRWDDVGDKLDQTTAVVENLDLGRGAFSFAATGTADYYASLRTRVIELLSEGAKQTHGAAAALRAVRSDFESTEENIQAAVGALWQPVA